MEGTSQQLTDKAREMQARIAPQIQEARRNLTNLNSRVTTFIRQNPGACLLGALAFGFLIGKMAARR
jgi:hypothetical protein